MGAEPDRRFLKKPAAKLRLVMIVCTRIYNFLFCCITHFGLRFQVVLQGQKFREIYKGSVATESPMDLPISKLIWPYRLAWHCSNKAVTLSFDRRRSGNITGRFQWCTGSGYWSPNRPDISIFWDLDWISFLFQPEPDYPNEIKCGRAKNLDME